ncbi:MAG TPA: SLC13 family permease [Lachnospiraceae bacterium]|nr:SLC13 family permease [Lachnospiraceae bacterium]
MQIKQKIMVFIKKETVLCVALFLALTSMLFVVPDREYLSYIDYRVLAILFSLMVVMAGYQQTGVFSDVAHALLKRAKNLRILAYLMVFMCFFFSMLITNDVALLTFVPFTLLLLSLSGMEEKAVTIVVYETIAANLGSMFTPVGNPQNLYLFTASKMSIGEFFSITAPITGVSALLLLISCISIPRLPVTLQPEEKEIQKRSSLELIFYTIVFLLSLLAVLNTIPVQVPFFIALLGTLFIGRKVLLKVDYCLLLTFVAFFVFIGNVGRIPVIRDWITQVLVGREMILSFLASQVISNVPAAVLLSGFTKEYAALIRGTDIGGLGTLIASLASLISFKCFVKEFPQKKGKFLLDFTLVNTLYAIILLGFTTLIVS